MIDTCVLCGEYVPEGTMICDNCKTKYLKEDDPDKRYASKDMIETPPRLQRLISRTRRRTPRLKNTRSEVKVR